MGAVLFANDETEWTECKQVMFSALELGQLSFGFWTKKSSKAKLYTCSCNVCSATVSCMIRSATTEAKKQEMRFKWLSFLNVSTNLENRAGLCRV